MNSRILIVDDNLEIHADFRKILAPEGGAASLDALEASIFGTAGPEALPTYDLDFASQGIEALAKVHRAIAEGRPYGMAFVDVRMPPGWDGVQTICEIRKADPAMQFVICTAFSDYTPEEASRKVGLADGLIFVVKPFEASIMRQLAQRMGARSIAA